MQRNTRALASCKQHSRGGKTRVTDASCEGSPLMRSNTTVQANWAKLSRRRGNVLSTIPTHSYRGISLILILSSLVSFSADIDSRMKQS
jgi:hypothetical protein